MILVPLISGRFRHLPVRSVGCIPSSLGPLRAAGPPLSVTTPQSALTRTHRRARSEIACSPFDMRHLANALPDYLPRCHESQHPLHQTQGASVPPTLAPFFLTPISKLHVQVKLITVSTHAAIAVSQHERQQYRHSHETVWNGIFSATMCPYYKYVAAAFSLKLS